MKNTLTLAMLGLLALTPTLTHAADMPKKSLSTTDREFIKSAMEANIAEVEQAQLMHTNAQDPALQKFTGQMINDHTQAKNALEKIVTNLGIKAPTGVNAEEKIQMSQLQRLKEPEISKTYISFQKKAHQNAVALFESEETNGQNPALKEYAKTYLPKLKEHEAEVNELKPESMTPMSKMNKS